MQSNEQIKTNYYVSVAWGTGVESGIFGDFEGVLGFLKKISGYRSFHDIGYMKITIGEGYLNQHKLEQGDGFPPIYEKARRSEKIQKLFFRVWIPQTIVTVAVAIYTICRWIWG